MRYASGIIAAALLGVAVSATDAAAQWNIARFDEQRNHAWATFGLDPAFVGSIGYGRVLRIAGHDFQVSGEGGIAVAETDARDFRVRLGTRTSIARWRSVHVTGSAAFITRGTENEIYRGLNLGADVTGAVGVYRPGWFAAGEFGKDKAIITHVKHTDWYRTYHYADAKDGWYLDAGGTYHYGISGGVSIGSLELLARAGWQRTEDFNDLAVPLYGGVGVGFAF